MAWNQKYPWTEIKEVWITGIFATASRAIVFNVMDSLLHCCTITYAAMMLLYIPVAFPPYMGKCKQGNERFQVTSVQSSLF